MYRGVGALRAVLARAHVTAGTDGGGGVQVVPVEAVGVDGPPGVPCLATEADGEEFSGFAVAFAVVADRACYPQVGAAVGHVRQLAHDAPWGGESVVYVPQGAGAAEVREVEAGGGLTFGDVSGAVDTHEGERDAAQVGALQRGQPMADGLVTNAEDPA